MYGIYTYIWLIFMVNVGKYTIHGSSGVWKKCCVANLSFCWTPWRLYLSLSSTPFLPNVFSLTNGPWFVHSHQPPGCFVEVDGFFLTPRWQEKVPHASRVLVVFSQPIWKIWSSKWVISFPQNRDENKEYFELPPPSSIFVEELNCQLFLGSWWNFGRKDSECLHHHHFRGVTPS